MSTASLESEFDRQILNLSNLFDNRWLPSLRQLTILKDKLLATQNQWSWRSMFILVPGIEDIVSTQTELIQSLPGFYSFLDLSQYRITWCDMETNLHHSLLGKPYILVNVDDGSESLGTAACNVGADFEGRVDEEGLTIFECAMMVHHFPMILTRHNVTAAASRYVTAEDTYCPDIWQVGGKIKVKRDSYTTQDSRWGVPTHNPNGLII